ncbi:fluoride efflux transporter FluC [Nocardia harenae]|uniref:fluoride efflux transporter FluC n=1 Tax=Nocardia harenae TaxID=358707 RepID=UPI00082C0D1E|nr:CrcB family protein [Nocardia harenae]
MPTPLVPLRSLLLVGAGGLAGAALRYRLGVWFPHRAGGWPGATFAVNVTGAFLLGLLLEALVRMGPDTGARQRVRLTVGTGFLGAFTTYSTLAVDTDLLLRAGHPGTAAAYAVGTVLAGGLASTAGIALGALLHRRGAAR